VSFIHRLPAWVLWTVRPLVWVVTLLGTLAVLIAVMAAIALAVAYPNLPSIASLTEYRPKLPLRVLSADGVLIG
jgi:penicillin-binding protein 1A